ncbi:MAG: phosphoenolpyruvate--protein phosphotransferase [Planctomycetes bacterium]|nr:phosphoenolpyruvate--protein phosphotransferase [Planctomycetota bacterium]
MARLELFGQTVAPGIGTGVIAFADVGGNSDLPPRHIPKEQVKAAIALFDSARHRAIQSLERVQAATARELGLQDAAIYGAQVAILHDPSALSEIRELIEDKLLAPESAIQSVVEKFSLLFENLEGGDMKNWAGDLRDPWYAVQRELALGQQEDLKSGDAGPIILVAEELVPSLATRLPREKLAGIICKRGGRFSHGAVVARSFGIPTVTGVDQLSQQCIPGESAVIYANNARLLLGADQAELGAASKKAQESTALRDILTERAAKGAVMACGTKISVMVNVESPRDLKMFDPNIVDGVGLFRTEFAYMERPTFPSSAEQAKIYMELLSHFPGKPVVFRTLDIGNDKQLRYFSMPDERNPALGWRGLRLVLKWKDLLLAQIQGLLEARPHGDLRIMLPMLTVAEEVREVRKLLDQVLPEGMEPPPLGAMLEVPAAAMALSDIVEEVDFISVGTNDLVQYLFAVDRDNPWVADLYQPFHPAHLRLLLHIARTCNKANVPLSVCGEMAGQLEGALFMVGAGFDHMSVSPPFVPELKAVLAVLGKEELTELAHQAAACKDSASAFALLSEVAGQAWSTVVKQFVRPSS